MSRRRRSINDRMDRMYFTYDDSTREIFLAGSVITEKQLKEIATILDRHLIPEKSTRYFYESLIFSIANQRMKYEGVMQFMKKMHALSEQELLDADKVYHAAINGSNRLWFLENRFEPSYKYVNDKGGIDRVVSSYITEPRETRKELDRIKWLGLKTASLWYLCLGGTDDMLCLDVHNTIQSKGLGIDVPKNYYIPKERMNGVSKGKKVHNQISGNLYLRVERELTNIFMNSKLVEGHPQYFISDNGVLNGSFVTALLWWQGTQGYRGNHASQLSLFDDAPRFQSPFSPK